MNLIIPIIIDIFYLIYLQLLDLWRPSEKALYADYFARRDIRKREFVERWQKKYGKPVIEDE